MVLQQGRRVCASPCKADDSHYTSQGRHRGNKHAEVGFRNKKSGVRAIVAVPYPPHHGSWKRLQKRSSRRTVRMSQSRKVSGLSRWEGHHSKVEGWGTLAVGCPLDKD